MVPSLSPIDHAWVAAESMAEDFRLHDDAELQCPWSRDGECRAHRGDASGYGKVTAVPLARNGMPVTPLSVMMPALDVRRRARRGIR